VVQRYDFCPFIRLVFFVLEVISSSGGVALLLFQLVAAHVFVLAFLFEGFLLGELLDELRVLLELLFNHFKLFRIEYLINFQLIFGWILQLVLVSLSEIELGRFPLHDVLHFLGVAQLLREKLLEGDPMSSGLMQACVGHNSIIYGAAALVFFDHRVADALILFILLKVDVDQVLVHVELGGEGAQVLLTRLLLRGLRIDDVILRFRIKLLEIHVARLPQTLVYVRR